MIGTTIGIIEIPPFVASSSSSVRALSAFTSWAWVGVNIELSECDVLGVFVVPTFTRSHPFLRAASPFMV